MIPAVIRRKWRPAIKGQTDKMNRIGRIATGIMLLSFSIAVTAAGSDYLLIEISHEHGSGNIRLHRHAKDLAGVRAKAADFERPQHDLGSLGGFSFRRISRDLL